MSGSSTNEAKTLHSTSLNCPVDLCIVFETKTLHHRFNFTTYSTLLNCPIDPCIVFEAETLHHLLDFVHSSCQSSYCPRNRNICVTRSPICLLSDVYVFSAAYEPSFKMSGLTGMPPPKIQDMFQVVNIDDAVAEREWTAGQLVRFPQSNNTGRFSCGIHIDIRPPIWC